MAINFAKVLEADLSQESGGGPRKRLAPGTYQAAISKVAQRTFDSGSEALSIEYTVLEGDYASLSINENIFTVGSAEKGSKELPFGYAKIKNRLMKAGITNEQMAKFKFPKNERELADFAKILGRTVTITVDNETQKAGKGIGTVRAAVKRVEAAISEE